MTHLSRRAALSCGIIKDGFNQGLGGAGHKLEAEELQRVVVGVCRGLLSAIGERGGGRVQGGGAEQLAEEVREVGGRGGEGVRQEGQAEGL